MENKNKSWFVKTQDKNVADELLAFGFKLVDTTNGTWTFINSQDKPLTFDDKKLMYSNTLVF